MTKFIYLKEDAISYGSTKHKVIYGKRGELVTIVRHCGAALIVESKLGKRFPVRTEKTSAEQIVVEQPKQVVIPKVKPVEFEFTEPLPVKKQPVTVSKKVSKPEKPIQGSLF